MGDHPIIKAMRNKAQFGGDRGKMSTASWEKHVKSAGEDDDDDDGEDQDDKYSVSKSSSTAAPATAPKRDPISAAIEIGKKIMGIKDKDDDKNGKKSKPSAAAAIRG